MAKGELNNSEKAALTLMSLGTKQAASIMGHLSENEVKRLSKSFMQLREVEREVQQGVAKEFLKMLKAADTLVVDGREFAEGVIAQAFGREAGANLLEYISGSKKEPLAALLGDMSSNLMDNFINSEHPQTIAFLMTKMTADQAADMLSRMKEDLQTDIILRISQLDNVKSHVIDEVREVLRAQLRGVGLREEEQLGGTKAAADILNFVDRASEERIVGEIEEGDAELAEEIRNLMFTFEDTLRLDDRSVQTLLKDVPREQLLLSLKTASPALTELLFRNMSQRAAQMLKEDLDTLGPTKLKDVEKSQQGIVDIIRRLEAEGKIQVAGGGGEDQLV